MRVLFWAPGASDIPGGHQVQASGTASALEALGVKVDLRRQPTVHLEGYDIVHGFGLSQQQVRECRVRGLPVCISTIYWSRRYTMGLDQRMGGGIQLGRRARLAAGLSWASLQLRHVEKSEALLGASLAARQIFESADMLLPNSEMEADAIRRELGVSTPVHVVPNGIDTDVFGLGHSPPEQRRPLVVSVARFEPHKNQLSLIKALRRRPYELLLVGPVHPHHHDYLERCKKEATPRMRFLGALEPRDLAALYAEASVHVLPSWYETTGLVSLEAAACGAKVVSTDRGYAQSYFDEHAWYCDPGDIRSIATAVDHAMDAPFNPILTENVMTKFTWKEAARATHAAYHRVLRG